jgi:hypothetical protein
MSPEGSVLTKKEMKAGIRHMMMSNQKEKKRGRRSSRKRRNEA